jgi:hypothetical protein
MAFYFNICRLVVTKSKYSVVMSKFLIRFVLFCFVPLRFFIYSSQMDRKVLLGRAFYLSHSQDDSSYLRVAIFFYIYFIILYSPFYPLVASSFCDKVKSLFFCRIKFEPSPTQVKQDAQRKTVCERDERECASGLPKYIK